jgi:two-component system, response regulator
VSARPKSVVILMADDDADDRLLAQDAVAEARITAELRFVENGEELMDYLLRRSRYATADATRPALIILDLNMPRKDGREALREIKAHPELRRIPVVILTTSKAESDIAQIYDLGANSFISKPVSFESLVKVMKTLGEYWLDTVELPAQQ